MVKASSYKVTRREFLKNAGLAAGSALLATTTLSLAGCTKEKQGGQVSQETVKYACPWCIQEFNDRNALEAHITATHPGKGFGPIPVALMLSSIDNHGQLKRRADELIKRNFLATIRAGGIIDVIGSAYVKVLSQTGFDIACQAKIDAKMSYSDKFEQTRAMKQELETLLGTQVKGYGSASRFAIDHDTSKIISQLGGGYIHVSSRTTRHPDQTLEPELVPGLPDDAAVVCCWQQSRGLYNKGTDLLAQDILAMSGSN